MAKSRREENDGVNEFVGGVVLGAVYKGALTRLGLGRGNAKINFIHNVYVT